MKTTTLTFHASHNYGSMLQTYALQQVMTEIFGHNQILNFRSARQKRMMRVLSFRPNLGPILKDLTHLLYYRSLKRKYDLFEKFIHANLNLTTGEIGYVKPDDLSDFDLICCGSDQIWNPCPEDFDLAYLLPFPLKAKKISYAASMGPGRTDWPEPISKYPELLKDFDAISVRESGTATEITRLSGRNDVVVHCDPVLLVRKNEWQKLIDPKSLISGKYIFLYTLYAHPLIIGCAKELSRKYNLPVVISNYTNQYDLFSPFHKHLKCGPAEFLNLLSNAEMIVTSSFHGTAFSILLNKPFVTINGLQDNRISGLLRLTGLTARSVSSADDIIKIGWDVDFSNANKAIEKERQKAFDYLSQFTS